MKRKVLLSSVVASILFLSTGCDGGGSGNSNSTSENSVSGVVSDGHIKGAKVCIDLNANNQCDWNEPRAITDENGNYTIITSDNINGKQIVATDGYDIGRGVEFKSTLIGYIDESGKSINITPITNFTTIYAMDKGIGFDAAKQDVASILGIDVNDIEKDPTDTDILQKASLKLQLVAETAANLMGKSTIDIYRDMAHNASMDKNLSSIIDQTFTDSNIKLASHYISNSIEKNNIKDLDNIQKNLITIVQKSQNNGVNIANSSYIDNYISVKNSYKDLNLSYSNFENKIDSEIADTKAESNKIANINDAKNTVSEIRDTIYEFLDPNAGNNQENNTSTIAGEVVSNYNSAIQPAIDSLNEDVNDSLAKIDDATKQFDKDFDEFNESLTHLNDRLTAISNVFDEHNTSDEYNDTTDYNDSISHTYSKADDGYITETFKLNDKTLTAKYYEDTSSKIYISSEPITLNKDGEYEISVNSISVENDKYELNLSGVIYDIDDASKKIDLKNATLTLDLDPNKYDNTLDKLQAFSNIDLNISADVVTKNGIFNGDIVLNNGEKYLKGVLDYTDFNGVKLDGTLRINTSTNDLLRIENDHDKKYNDYVPDTGLVLLNGNLVTKMVEYNFVDNDETHSHEENLTSTTGEIAHCTITEDDYSHSASCDKNVVSYNINDKMVSATINGANVLLDHLDSSWDDEGKRKYYYHFKDSSDKSYDLTPDNNSYDINNIQIQNPTTALDVAGNIKFSGIVTTPKVNVSLDLVAQSEANDEGYHIIATDVNVTNNDNIASIDYLEITKNKNKEQEYPYYSNYEKNYDDNPDENTSETLLKNLNATLYDTNNNPVKVTDTNVLFDDSNKTASIYGTIEYIDTKLNGFIGVTGSNDEDKYLLYLTVDRNGYQPFELSTKLFHNTQNDYSNSETGIKKGAYSVYLNQKYINATDDRNITGHDSNGVYIDISRRGDNDSDVKIQDRNGNSLVTFDPKSNTVTYDDGSSETIY